MEIILPYPPGINKLYKTGKGRFYKSKVGHSYDMVVKAIIMKLKIPPIPANALIEMHVNWFPADKRKRDVDSGLKALLDALQRSGIYANDVQIKRLVVEMGAPLPKDYEPYCRVLLDIIS